MPITRLVSGLSYPAPKEPYRELMEANWRRVDRHLAPLSVRTQDDPPTNRFLDVAAGWYVTPGGRLDEFLGGTIEVPDAATSYVFLAPGDLQSNTTGWPAGDHLRLAVVTAAGGVVTALTDARVQYASGGLGASQGGLLWSAVSTLSLANSVVETAILDDQTVPLGFFASGRGILWNAKGRLSATGTPTLRLRLKSGVQLVVDSGALSMSGTPANVPFEMDAELWYRSPAGGLAGALRLSFGTTVHRFTPVAVVPAIDPATAATTVSLTVQWSVADAGNSIVRELGRIEVRG